jgi:hypothetical protein
MKILIALISFGLAIASVQSAGAATKKRAKAVKTAKAKKKQQQPKEHLSTSFNFDDHGVTGEYQMPDEALAKVENEKSLSDLLGVRKHFKDRLAEASEQE